MSEGLVASASSGGVWQGTEPARLRRALAACSILAGVWPRRAQAVHTWRPSLNAIPFPEQRWVKPYPTEAGFWKRQLPTKALAPAVEGDIAGLERLLEQQPEALNRRGPHGRTLLWEAARKGHTGAVEWLLAKGADVGLTGCYNGESAVQLTPFCAAHYYRRGTVAQLLQAVNGAELDVFRAAFMGEMSVLSRYLEDEPSLLHAEDPEDLIYYTPLLAFAVAGGRMDVTVDLEQRGAEVGPYSAQLLRIALSHGRTDIAEHLLRNGLLARAADSGIFQLCDDLEFLQRVIDSGASPSASGVNGFPPLVFAARGDKGEHPEKVALLLANGADVNAREAQGRTALHYAAAAGHRRVAALLLAHGADRTLRSEAGETPRDVALRRGRLELAADL